MFHLSASRTYTSLEETLISTMSSPTRSAPVVNSAQVSKSSPLVIIDLDDVEGDIKSSSVTRKKNLILESQKPPLKLQNKTSITKSMVENEYKRINVSQKGDKTGRTSNFQHQAPRGESRNSGDIPLRTQLKATNLQPTTQVLEDKGSSSSDELGLFKERRTKVKSPCSLASTHLH